MPKFQWVILTLPSEATKKGQVVVHTPVGHEPNQTHSEIVWESHPATISSKQLDCSLQWSQLQIKVFLWSLREWQNTPPQSPLFEAVLANLFRRRFRSCTNELANMSMGPTFTRWWLNHLFERHYSQRESFLNRVEHDKYSKMELLCCWTVASGIVWVNWNISPTWKTTNKNGSNSSGWHLVFEKAKAAETYCCWSRNSAFTSWG